MSIYHIERGGHADMKRVYPMMTFDFHKWELPGHLEFQRAMLRGCELLLLKDAQNIECGYAVMLRHRLGGYALLGWLGVYPHVRGNGVGGEFLSLIREYYAGWNGIILEVTEYPELEKAVKLHNFYLRNGYSDINCRYKLAGRDCALMYLPIDGPKDISPIIGTVMRGVYACLVSEPALWRYISIEKD